MFSKLREPFGTAGLVVASVALVFALGGGAWALTASTNGGKHHFKANGGKHHFKAKRHARGIRGPQGPVGPEGPEGPPGVNGKNGTNGRNGIDGINGLPGKSVASGTEPAGENCEQGGYWFEIQGSGSKQYVCNGSGGGGSAGGTELAPGDTETGVWSLIGKGLPSYYVNISFPLRAPANTTPRFPGEDPVHCAGSASSPEAAPGYFCMYTVQETNTFPTFQESPNTTIGLIIEFGTSDEEKVSSAFGTWALTAACPEEEPTC